MKKMLIFIALLIVKLGASSIDENGTNGFVDYSTPCQLYDTCTTSISPYYDYLLPEVNGLSSSFQSTLYGLNSSYQQDFYVSNVLAHEYSGGFLSNSGCIQTVGVKRLAQHMEESPPSKQIQETSNASDSSNVNIFSNNRQIQTKLGIWNNTKLKNKHRKGLYAGYVPTVNINSFKKRGYKKIGNEKHHLLLKTHIKDCMDAFSEIQTKSGLLFIIANRTTYVHTKLADCKAICREIEKEHSKYAYIEEIKRLSDYYPGLLSDILKFMDKHGPIQAKNNNKIQTEWIETLGDIYVRTLIKSEHVIEKKATILKNSNTHRTISTAIRMLLSLPEVYNDLSSISGEFLKDTLEEDTVSKHLEVVKVLHEIVEKCKNLIRFFDLNVQYASLYNIYSDIIQQESASHESIVIQLYTEMYKSLAYFYEKAEVCEEMLGSKKKKKYHLLTGKCIVKPQRYIKCTTTIDLNKPVCENTHIMEEETNKWTISADVQKHYHIHYVDNTKQKYTRLCMPMLYYSIHSVSQTIEYLKKIYSIEKEECVCPYKRNSSGEWKYIQEDERYKTVNEFVECDVVFYYIKEGLKDDYFTFAEFESCKKPMGTTMRIPLFLSSLMRSAVSMGPFKEADKIKHTVVGNMQCMNRKPDVYVYTKKYKTIDYLYIHHYYSNLYIRKENIDILTIDCYIMDSKSFINNETVTVEWYVKVPNSVDEYTHCILSDELVNDQGKYDKFIEAVISQEYTPDSELYGFGLQSSVLNDLVCCTSYSTDSKDIIYFKINIMSDLKINLIQSNINELNRETKQNRIERNNPEITKEQKMKLKKKRNAIYMKKYKNMQKIKNIQLHCQTSIKEESSTALFSPCTFVVFQYSNSKTKSNLGAYNELFNIFTRRYN